MWIRSQDRESLINANSLGYKELICFEGNEHTITDYEGSLLGKYKSKERVVDILDDIQEFLTIGDVEEYNTSDGEMITVEKKVYQMPEK